MSTHARPLAEWLAAANDSQLAALFRARAVREDVAWSDFFDAAEGLLEPSSIERMLPQLTLDEATVLRRAVDGGTAADTTRDDTAQTLIALALLRPDGTPAPPVADVVAGREIPSSDPVNGSGSASEQAAARAAERAFTTVAAIADLLLLTVEQPLALLAAGTLTAGERRRVADLGTPADIVDDLVAIAVDAGLLVVHERRLLSAPTQKAWLPQSVSDRWTQLVGAFRSALPRGLRAPNGGWLPVPEWARQHPWDQTWPDRCAALRTRALLLGLIAEDGTEPAWAVALRRGAQADASELERMLPPAVDKIFLQNDLTAIAPGPLEPALDVRLRGIAVRESAAQASSYRFTAASVAHALTADESAASILDFLGGISLTGIPQPLEYLVTQAEQRHGLVRVFTDPSGRTRISSAETTLIDTMGVDQALRPLALTRDGAELTSRVGRDTVYWSLADAHYPAMIVDGDGKPLVVGRTPAPQPAPAREPDHSELIARLRARQGPDADAAWLDRELDAAVRARAVLHVEIEMPDGSTRELELEASGLGGGRLRGRDRAADVERTLPVRSIRSAHVVGPPADETT